MNDLYRLSRYLRPYGSRMIAAVAATCGVGIATLGIVTLLPSILDRLNGDVEGLPVDGVVQTAVTTTELLRLAGSLVVLYMLL